MALGSIGAIVYSILAKDKTAEGLDSASARFRKMGTVAGGAMTAVGGGLTLLTDKAKKMNAPLVQTALQLGIDEEKMRDLALETTNVTFPLSEVTATMDLLARAGMKDAETIGDVATTFDTLGDATGKSASEVANIMIPALKAFKIPLEDAADHTDILTHLSRNTTVGLGEFSQMLKYIAPELDTMDISMQDSVAVMEALADKGITGSAATREFRSAISESKGDTDLFYDSLGLTRDVIDEYSAKIDDSTGITNDFAAAANTQYGAIDDVKQMVSELTLKYGSMLEPLDGIGKAMTVVGPAMMGLSNMGPAIGAVKGMGGAMKTLGMTMLTPPMGVVIAIGAIILILIALEKKFGIFSKLAGIVMETLKPVAKFFTGAFSAAIETAKGIIGIFGDKLLVFLGPIGLIVFAFKHWEEIPGMITGALSTVYDIIKKPFDDAYAFITGLYDTFLGAGEGLIQAMIDGITSLIDKPRELIESALDRVRDLLPFSDAKEGPLSDLTKSGKSVMTTFAKGVDSAKGAVSGSFGEALESSSFSKASTSGSSGSAGGDTYGGDSISIGHVSLSNDYDFPALMKDIENYQSSKRVQRGIRTL